MEVVNPFILKNKERMVVFLDQLSSVQDPGNAPSTSNNNYDIGKKLLFCLFLLFLRLWWRRECGHEQRR